MAGPAASVATRGHQGVAQFRLERAPELGGVFAQGTPRC